MWSPRPSFKRPQMTSALEPGVDQPGHATRHSCVSYSHKDDQFLNDLLDHLKPYVRSEAVLPWSDKQIQPGSRWFAEIQAALATTRVAVLLVTKNFLASDLSIITSLGPLLQQAKAGGVKLFWVPVRACSFHETALKDIQAVFPPDKPLAEIEAREEGQGLGHGLQGGEGGSEFIFASGSGEF